MFTLMSEEEYERVCDEGTKICIMCGQHNKKENASCWYCGANPEHVVPMSEHGSIRSTSELPVGNPHDPFHSMRVDSMDEFRERIANINGRYKAECTNERYKGKQDDNAR